MGLMLMTICLVAFDSSVAAGYDGVVDSAYPGPYPGPGEVIVGPITVTVCPDPQQAQPAALRVIYLPIVGGQ